MFLGTSYLEWSAVLSTALCIFLAGRNNVHTWWIGIIACILYGFLFYGAKLYADVTLQAFFIVTGIIGWISWVGTERWKSRSAPAAIETLIVQELPISKVKTRTLVWYAVIGASVTLAYGYILHTYTDAYAPWIDSTVLTLSVVAQLMLMRRQIETWPVWLAVNTLAVPLFFSRELYLSAAMYSVFWVNAIWAWNHWSKLKNEAVPAKSNKIWN